MKATTKAKSGKAVSSLDVVNVSLASDLSSSLNLTAEKAWFDKALSMLKGGTISVRGIKATIEKAEEIGSAPTLKASHAQYFVNAEKVRNLAGGKDQALKAILNATIQGKREFGADFDQKLEGAKSFAEFANSIPAQSPKTREAHHNEKKAPTVDEALKALGLALKAKGHTTDIKLAEAVAKALAVELTFQRAQGGSVRLVA